MARMSVGLRLTIWYSAVLLVALALFGLLTWIALDHWLMRGVDERLAQKVQGMRTVLEVEGLRGEGLERSPGVLRSGTQRPA